MASTTHKYTKKLVGQHILVLGGTSGIGYCVAEAGLENGANIIISSSASAKVERAVERLRDAYPTLITTQCFWTCL